MEDVLGKQWNETTQGQKLKSEAEVFLKRVNAHVSDVLRQLSYPVVGASVDFDGIILGIYCKMAGGSSFKTKNGFQSASVRH